jgi:hypothetical protein
MNLVRRGTPRIKNPLDPSVELVAIAEIPPVRVISRVRRATKMTCSVRKS